MSVSYTNSAASLQPALPRSTVSRICPRCPATAPKQTVIAWQGCPLCRDCFITDVRRRCTDALMTQCATIRYTKVMLAYSGGAGSAAVLNILKEAGALCYALPDAALTAATTVIPAADTAALSQLDTVSAMTTQTAASSTQTAASSTQTAASSLRDGDLAPYPACTYRDGRAASAVEAELARFDPLAAPAPALSAAILSPSFPFQHPTRAPPPQPFASTSSSSSAAAAEEAPASEASAHRSLPLPVESPQCPRAAAGFTARTLALRRRDAAANAAPHSLAVRLLTVHVDDAFLPAAPVSTATAAAAAAAAATAIETATTAATASAASSAAAATAVDRDAAPALATAAHRARSEPAWVPLPHARVASQDSQDALEELLPCVRLARWNHYCPQVPTNSSSTSDRASSADAASDDLRAPATGTVPAVSVIATAETAAAAAVDAPGKETVTEKGRFRAPPPPLTAPQHSVVPVLVLGLETVVPPRLVVAPYAPCRCPSAATNSNGATPPLASLDAAAAPGCGVCDPDAALRAALFAPSAATAETSAVSTGPGYSVTAAAAASAGQFVNACAPRWALLALQRRRRAWLRRLVMALPRGDARAWLISLLRARVLQRAALALGFTQLASGASMSTCAADAVAALVTGRGAALPEIVAHVDLRRVALPAALAVPALHAFPQSGGDQSQSVSQTESQTMTESASCGGGGGAALPWVRELRPLRDLVAKPVSLYAHFLRLPLAVRGRARDVLLADAAADALAALNNNAALNNGATLNGAASKSAASKSAATGAVAVRAEAVPTVARGSVARAAAAAGASANSLAESFLRTMQAAADTTVPNIVRTAEKLAVLLSSAGADADADAAADTLAEAEGDEDEHDDGRSGCGGGGGGSGAGKKKAGGCGSGGCGSGVSYKATPADAAAAAAAPAAPESDSGCCGGGCSTSHATSGAAAGVTAGTTAGVTVGTAAPQPSDAAAVPESATAPESAIATENAASAARRSGRRYRTVPTAGSAAAARLAAGRKPASRPALSEFLPAAWDAAAVLTGDAAAARARCLLCGRVRHAPPAPLAAELAQVAQIRAGGTAATAAAAVTAATAATAADGQVPAGEARGGWADALCLPCAELARPLGRDLAMMLVYHHVYKA